MSTDKPSPKTPADHLEARKKSQQEKKAEQNALINLWMQDLGHSPNQPEEKK